MCSFEVEKYRSNVGVDPAYMGLHDIEISLIMV